MAQLASKPRASLNLRFGAEVLLRLDQALGSVTEALTSLVPPEVPRAELRFAEPVGDPEDLKRIIDKLCEMLCRDLETRGIGARRLDLVFMRVDNLAQAVRVGLSRPYREPEHLAKLLAETAGVGRSRLRHRNRDAHGLVGRGADRTADRRPACRPRTDRRSMSASWSIRSASAWARTTFSASRRSKARCPNAPSRRLPALHPAKGLDWPKNLPRPARLVCAAREGRWRSPRCRIIRRASSSGATSVIASPRRTVPNAFTANGGSARARRNLVRDYYRVETADGARYWLFRDAPADQGGSWWLHGVGEA